MDCKEAQTWLPGYVDGELDLVRAVEIEGHCEACPACARDRDRLQALQASIRAADLGFRCPNRLRASIQTAVRSQTRRPPTSQMLPRRWLSIAASLFLLASVGWLAWQPYAGRPGDDLIAREVLASHVRSLLADHLTDVASSDRHTVKPWFAGKLDFAPAVADLSSAGFPLVGGRLDYLEHRSVAALVYSRRQHMINLFVWPTDSSTAGALQASSRQGYQIVQWTERGMAYWAITDLNSSELQQFVELIRAAQTDGETSPK